MLGPLPSPRCENLDTPRRGLRGTEPFLQGREPPSEMTQGRGELRAAQPQRRGVNDRPHESRGKGDPRVVLIQGDAHPSPGWHGPVRGNTTY